jgi:dTDP-4-dehydrorhamnose 3,5-epimerase
MPFTFTKLAIPEVVLVEPKVFGDDRGFFMETFKESEFKDHGIAGDFCQDNHSLSSKGVLRGLHFQLDPHAQGKLVRVIRGKVFDVAVDIRKGSPTYGKWVSEELSSKNKRMLWVPQGFAHGVLVLEDDTELLYKVSGAEYNPEKERCILWDDPSINIDWPLKEVLLSDKDKEAVELANVENNFTKALA